MAAIKLTTGIYRFNRTLKTKYKQLKRIKMNYTQGFEDWWKANYKNTYNSEYEQSYKKLAYITWQHQQAKIDELIETIEFIQEDLNDGYVRK